MKVISKFRQVINKLNNIPRFLKWFLPVLLALFSIIDNILKWGVVKFIWEMIKATTDFIWNQVVTSPLLTGFILIVFFILVVFWRRLRLVAGEFRDNFSEGLGKWEFGGEGWKTEQEDGASILSISESEDGGITKKGFNWSDHSFTFMCKVIKRNVGWIVRAENRSKYLMIQLKLKDVKKPKLRLHLRIPYFSREDMSWIVIEENDLSPSKKIELNDWINVRIDLLGSNIDVFLNGEQAAHYFVADPLRVPTEFTPETVELQILDKKTKEVKATEKVRIIRQFIPMDYSSGRVGFRCGHGEHAHIKKVVVKPLFK